MGIKELFTNPVRSAILTALEMVFNNADSSILQKIAELAKVDLTDYKPLIQKYKKMVKHISINVDDKSSRLIIHLKLAGETDEFEISAKYAKKVRKNDALIQFSNILSSKEWITIFIKDILIDEEIISKEDLSISTDDVFGKILDKVL